MGRASDAPDHVVAEAERPDEAQLGPRPERQRFEVGRPAAEEVGQAVEGEDDWAEEEGQGRQPGPAIRELARRRYASSSGARGQGAGERASQWHRVPIRAAAGSMRVATVMTVAREGGRLLLLLEVQAPAAAAAGGAAGGLRTEGPREGGDGGRAAASWRAGGPVWVCQRDSRTCGLPRDGVRVVVSVQGGPSEPSSALLAVRSEAAGRRLEDHQGFETGARASSISAAARRAGSGISAASATCHRPPQPSVAPSQAAAAAEGLQRPASFAFTSSPPPRVSARRVFCGRRRARELAAGADIVDVRVLGAARTAVRRRTSRRRDSGRLTECGRQSSIVHGDGLYRGQGGAREVGTRLRPRKRPAGRRPRRRRRRQARIYRRRCRRRRLVR